MTGRRDHYRDPAAPTANSVVPGGSAVVVDDRRRVLMQRLRPGIYIDPAHVTAYPDGEVRQEFSVTYLGWVVGGSIAVGDESTEVRFVDPGEFD